MTGLCMVYGIIILYLWREDLADWIVEIGIRIRTEDVGRSETNTGGIRKENSDDTK